MAIHKTLLATVALPLLSLSFTFQPATSAPLRPALAIEQDQPVVMVAMSIEEARARLKAARQALAAAKSSGGDVAGARAAVAAAKAELDAARAGGGNDGGDNDGQPAKRKKQQQADDTTAEQPAQSEEQAPPVKKPKRKQQVEAPVMDDSGNAGGADGGMSAMPEADQDATEQPVKKKKKVQPAPDTMLAPVQQPLEQPADAQTMQPADQGQVAAPAQDDAQAIKQRIEKRKKRKERQQQAGGVQKQEEVAKDPAKTTDTVVLPVENGAAVLDSDKEADNTGDDSTRAKRKKLREQAKQAKPPKSDAEAQAGVKVDANVEKVLKQPVLKEKGKRVRQKPVFEQQDGRRVGKGNNVRVVINVDNRVVVRNDDRDRLGFRAQDVYFEQLSGGRTRQVVIKPDGTKIVTVRNRYGEIIRRSRISPSGPEIVIFFSPELELGGERLYLRDPGFDLPPMRLRIPVEDYIIDTSTDPDRDYRAFLAEPPVERVERVYSVDEVKYSARIRDKVRRIDLDTLTFGMGSAEISMNQAQTLRKVADAISRLLDEDPGETFLIEGHTDAVGSDESNLVLSDQRAEAVATLLTEVYDIPAENLTTQGYGERFLKVETEESERANRRVTIRRITSLVRPAESAQVQ